MTRKFRVGEVVKVNKSLRKRFTISALICRQIEKLGMVKRKYKDLNDKNMLYEVVFSKYTTYRFIFYRKEISHVSKSKRDEFIAEKVAEQL
jgi:hypothetical protein